MKRSEPVYRYMTISLLALAVVSLVYMFMGGDGEIGVGALVSVYLASLDFLRKKCNKAKENGTKDEG